MKKSLMQSATLKMYLKIWLAVQGPQVGSFSFGSGGDGLRTCCLTILSSTFFLSAFCFNIDEDEANEFQDEGNLGGMSQTMLDLCEKVPSHALHATEDNAVWGTSAHDDEEHVVSMNDLLGGQKHVQATESASKNGVHAIKASPEKESAAEDGFLTAKQPPTQESSLHGTAEIDTVAEYSAGTRFTQRIDAIETRAAIVRSSVAIPPSDTNSSPKTKPPTQNIGIVGKAAKGIRNGKAGRTTFSALDLPTPKCPK